MEVGISRFLGKMEQALNRALDAMTKPASAAARQGTIAVQTYRGYGSQHRIFLMGRVLHQSQPPIRQRQGLEHKFKTLWHMFRRWGVANARLSVRFGEARAEVSTDRDGYFTVDLPITTQPTSARGWHDVSICLTEPNAVEAKAEVFIPSDACRFVVISDIDDTVMHTGVANKLMMIWRLFVQGAKSRIAFPGMAAFLRALHKGPDGDGANPLLYVSRAPWSIYGVLDEFFNLHDIPVGPILFLREWGLTLQSPLPRKAKDHKLALIRDMLTLYDELPFVLIGDSGQRDPEIYADIVRTHPNRVQAVYIRNVSADVQRQLAINRLAAEIAEAGSSLVLADDTLTMAKHAAAQGLIAEGASLDLRVEKAEHEIDQPPEPNSMSLRER